MARVARAVKLHVGGRWFDSVCAARFFRYETGALSHQFEAESTVRFSMIYIMEGAHRIVPGINHTSR